ncbi:MAG TPA: acyl-CoA dehydrogenase family protein [Polyangiaceae bacterium]
MDFGFSEEQLALQDLAKKIFRGLCSVESLAALEADAGGDGIHRVVWDGLGKAQMLGLALPEDVGGGGLGMIELCLLLEQAGDSVCPVPLIPTLTMAALPIAKFGTPGQRTALLPPVVRGDSVLTAALVESGDAPVTATRDGDSWVLSGTKDCVPALHVASRVLVPARTGENTIGVFIVDPNAAGVTVTPQVGTNGERLGRLELASVRMSLDAVLGDPLKGSAVVDFALERTYVGQCALELGIARHALILTAKYTTERHQFGRPIATFQAVAQRAGDAYVDVETIRLTVFRAAWLLDEGREATREIAVAKLVAAEAGHRVVCAAQHLHGGIGFDRDYPLYRYFLASKQNEFTLGAAASHVARLGLMIARES